MATIHVHAVPWTAESAGKLPLSSRSGARGSCTPRVYRLFKTFAPGIFQGRFELESAFQIS